MKCSTLAYLLILGLLITLAAPIRPAHVAAQTISLDTRPDMVTAETEAAIEKALAYLARTQSRDGSWSSGGGYGSYPVAMTSLAGLALMAGGNTPTEGKYAAEVRQAVEFVMDSASANGLICRIDREGRPMYGHGFGMLFLGQAYGMERDPVRQRELEKILERAIKLTQRSQSKDGGWLYSPDQSGDEGSVTITQIQGLRSIRNSGVKVPRSVIDKACGYIEKSANKDGSIRYRASMGGSSGRPPLTAAGVATLYNAGEYDNPVAEKCLDNLKRTILPKSPASMFSGHNFYGHLYMSQAMYLSSDENWKAYFPKTRNWLIKAQRSDGSWQGDRVGQVYGTSLGLLILQLPYANLPILQR